MPRTEPTTRRSGPAPAAPTRHRIHPRPLAGTHNLEVADKAGEGNVLAALGLRLPLLVLVLVLDEDEVVVRVLVGLVDDSESLVGHGDDGSTVVGWVWGLVVVIELGGCVGGDGEKGRRWQVRLDLYGSG